MGKEASVAPKERVNVVYRPATGDAQEEVELPLKILVMGDFTQREDDRAVEERQPINVDKNNFDDVLAGQELKLDTFVNNELDDDPESQLHVELDFKSIKDFEPDNIIKKVPELKKLFELREALKAVKGPLGNIPDFKKKVNALISDEGARTKLLAELGLDDK